MLGKRIEDHVLNDGSARRVGDEGSRGQRLAEIPAFHGNGRHGHIRIGAAVIPVQFQIGEEESLVTAVVQLGDDDGAANGAAVIPGSRPGPEKVPVAGTAVRLAGVEIFVANKDERGAVESIGAALAGEVVEAARDLAEFGGEVAALQREFL